MANEEQLSILRRSVEEWNEWREQNPSVVIDLRRASLREANLREANLIGANLVESNLIGINLINADLTGAFLHACDLRDCYLTRANLFGADLEYASLDKSDLTEANLHRANLSYTILRGANLTGSDLEHATLIKTDLSGATLSKCHVFGISAWKLKLEGAIQSDLVISDYDEPMITVDNLEIAQFIYLLIHNEKIRQVIDTITSKAVLILGRFTEERKDVLEAIRAELRKRNYTPILFDFEKPASRDLTETVMTLAGMARFVIADLSDPNSVPHELMSFVEKLRSVPVQAIFCPIPGHPNPYSMYDDFRDLRHVLPIYRYESDQQLLAELSEKVIAPAEAKVIELRLDRPQSA